MEIERSEKQAEKASFSIIDTRLSGSNVTLNRLVQEAKHPSERVSTDDGIQIDERNEHPENADFPRTEIAEKGSNATHDKSVQPRKQFSQRASIDEGIHTNVQGGDTGVSQ
jgi:hypothetical protein